tara:strand:+ start:344 stop:919 length:576 start_codon:yes stop_codon:yes gene_type:complete
VKIDFDVDIDMENRDNLLSVLKHVTGSIKRPGGMEKHNTGVYIQPIPHNPLTGLSNIDHKEAEEIGYFKLDVLNNSVYKGISTEGELDDLCAMEPMWNLFGHKEIVEQLFHINNHYDIVNKHMPTSIEQLAMILAMIRPGKRHLVGKSWEEIESQVWLKPDNDSYFFKKSHAFSYAMAIIVQLNKIVTDLS